MGERRYADKTRRYADKTRRRADYSATLCRLAATSCRRITVWPQKNQQLVASTIENPFFHHFFLFFKAFLMCGPPLFSKFAGHQGLCSPKENAYKTKGYGKKRDAMPTFLA